MDQSGTKVEATDSTLTITTGEIMTRFLKVCACSAALFVAPLAVSHAQAKLDIAAGASLPTGNFSNGAQAGYNVGLGLEIQPPLAPVGFRVEGAWNAFNGKSGAPNSRILSGTANLVYSLLGTPLGGPYLIGGAGMYNLHTDAFGAFPSASTNKAGFNVGGGFRFGLSGFSAFAEARYHYVSTSGGSTGYIPITFGVTF